VKDGKQLLKLKERATIEFEQFRGAAIQLEFRRLPAGDLQLELRPEFRENAAEKVAMTLPRLAELKKDLEKAIPEGEAKLVALGKEARALDDQLGDLGKAPGGAAYVAWQVKRTRLESALSSCKSQATRLQRRLPEMKARLAAVPQMQRFLSDLQQNGSLTVRVVAECGDARLVVCDARLAPQAE
jgi:prefoldin subunit 5